MALKPCPDCGHEVSPRAPSCPNCGAPIATPGRVRTAEDSALTRSRGCGDILLFGCLAVILLVLMLMGSC